MKETRCPGEVYLDKKGQAFKTKWHEDGDCKFCKGGGKRRHVNEMPQVDRSGNPIVDFCCHQCKSNYRSIDEQYQPTSVA